MFPFPPFLWFWEDGDQVATTTFTVAQPLAHVLCELPGSNQPLSPWVCRASQLSSSQPLSLWACTAQITLGASSPLLKISSQSSCPRFLTSTQLFTQLNFLTVLETIRVRVPHDPCLLPSPGVAQHPNFSGAGIPSLSGCIQTLCLLLHLYFPQGLPASRSLLVLGCPPFSGRGGSWWSNSPLCILHQMPD